MDIDETKTNKLENLNTLEQIIEMIKRNDSEVHNQFHPINQPLGIYCCDGRNIEFITHRQNGSNSNEVNSWSNDSYAQGYGGEVGLMVILFDTCLSMGHDIDAQNFYEMYMGLRNSRESFIGHTDNTKPDSFDGCAALNYIRSKEELNNELLKVVLNGDVDIPVLVGSHKEEALLVITGPLGFKSSTLPTKLNAFVMTIDQLRNFVDDIIEKWNIKYGDQYTITLDTFKLNYIRFLMDICQKLVLGTNLPILHIDTSITSLFQAQIIEPQNLEKTLSKYFFNY